MVRFPKLGLSGTAIALSFASLSLLLGCEDPVPSLEPSPWPKWVHRHWVWENVGDQESTKSMVKNYLDRDIPVGAIMIDRPWQTEPNTFVPDPERYPDLGGLIEEMHELDIRVMMWITSIVNEGASNFEEGKARGYFHKGGKLAKWWGGKGALLDYDNPEAVSWWHKQMDQILDLGIDGWKCDATDPMILLIEGPVDLLKAMLSPNKYGFLLQAWNKYKEQYYSDFFDYTRERLGNDRVITARPVDDYIGLGAPVTFAPRRANFAGWVGDQEGDFGGMRVALSNMATSAAKDYVSFGSDIAGFKGRYKRTDEVFVRWTQLGAFSTVMENGGNGVHFPWEYGDRVEEIYRKYTKLHHQLIEYIYGESNLAYRNGHSFYRQFRSDQGQWTYFFGRNFWVAPITNKRGTAWVTFPARGTWIDFFNEKKKYRSGRYQGFQHDLEKFPVFVRQGAVFPIDMEEDLFGHGSVLARDHQTIMIYPRKNYADYFPYYSQDEVGSLIAYEYKGKVLRMGSNARTDKPLLWRLQGVSKPKSIYRSSGEDRIEIASSSQGSIEMGAEGWFYDSERRLLWVKAEQELKELEISIQF